MKQYTFRIFKDRAALLLLALLAFTGLQAAPPPAVAPTYEVGDPFSLDANDEFTYPAPYGNYFWGARHQMLVRASELTAIGATAGNITALYFNVSAISGTPLAGFNIKIKATTTNDLSTWETGLTTVFTSGSYTESLGWNQHIFSTPYLWDGTSNLVIETCFNSLTFTQNAATIWTDLSFNASVFYFEDANGVCTNFNQSFPESPSTRRPNIGFDISPLPPCVSPPNAGNTVADLSDVCFGGTVSLSLFGSSSGIGQTYQWQSSVDGVNYTDIAGANAPTYSAAITAPTFFQCVITCSGQSAASFPASVGLLPPSQCYCTAGSDQCDEFISNVTVGSFTNPSTCGANGYTNYTNLTIDMIQQTAYNLVVQNGPPTYSLDECGIWVDWNQDGDFNDAGETITVLGTPGNGPYSAVINPPLGSLLGQTRMRIRISWDEAPLPCGSAQFGEVEDYTINVLPAPTCPIPFSLSASNITPFTADLDWADVAAAGSGYNLRYKLVSEPVTVSTWATPTAVAVSNFSLSGLLPLSNYEFQVEANCGTEQSGYSASFNFTTAFIPTANDECANAISLTQNATCTYTSGSVSNATQSLPGCVGNANDDVWFSFVATATSALVTVDGSALLNPVVQVFNACGGTSLGCVNTTAAGGIESVILSNNLTIGNTYFIRVYDFGAGTPGSTDFEICVSDLPNVIDITDGSASVCSGLFYDSGIGSDYLNNESYVFTLSPGVAGNLVGVQFNTFQLESGFDFLYIYDGTSLNAPLIGGFTGSNSPGVITATNPAGALTFYFTSDNSVPNPGWNANIFCVSPNAAPSCPGVYAPANNSTGVSVFADLTWINTAGGIPTGYDVYFGTSTPPPLVSSNQASATYDPGLLATGTTYFWQIIPNNAIGSASACVVNTFTTDVNVNVIMGGPDATTCGAGFFDSNPAGNYQLNENYTLTISPDVAGNLVQVAFSSFNIENNFDFLTIYNGPTTAAPILGVFTGTTSPGTINSTAPGGELTFVFTSDDFINAPGWAATVSCISGSLPPTCVVNALPANLATNVNFSSILTWNQGSGVPPTGYDVYFGTSSPPPLVSSGQTANSYDPGPLNFSTTYFWQVIPQNANGSASACAISSFTTAATVIYCPAGSDLCDEFINNVTLNTIANPSACGLGGYTNYTSISTSLAQGLFYPIVVGNGVNLYPGDQCGVWVDWNQDGDFTDVGEQQVISNTPGVGPYNGIVDVPPTALLGSTRMRIRITWTGAVDPCGITDYGEVEDYTINVVPPPACAYPGGIVFNNITNNSVDVDWNDVPAASSYNVRYKLLTDPTTVPTWVTPVNVLVSNYTATGLTSASDYEFQFESVCTPPSTSGFSPSVQVTTALDPCTNTVCLPTYIQENEVCGGNTNGGCNLTPPSYEPIACGDTICGTGWSDAGFRDTDWFTFTLTQPSTVTWTVDADFPADIGFINSNFGCVSPVFFNVVSNGGECSQAVTTDNLPAGTWWVFVAPNITGYPCGSGRNNYVANLQCVPLITAANDDCSGAIMLTQNTSCLPATYNVDNATQTLPGCSGTANDDVWFSFVATATSGVIEVDGSASFNPVVQVSTACSGTSLVCQNATGAGAVEVVQLNGLTIGQTYYFRVYDFGLGIPATTDFTVCVYETPGPPVNDDCTGAIPYVCGTPVSGNTGFATPEVGLSTCGTPITAPGLWYTVVGTGASITADLCTGTTYDSKINVFSGTCAGLVCVGGNDDFCGVNQASYTWPSIAGVTYYILVQGFNGQTGSFTLTVNYALPSATVTPGNDATLCAGSTLNLSANLSGVTWSNGETTQNIVVSTSGDYSFVANDPNGCSVLSDTVTVTASSGPVAPVITASGPTVFCSGNDVTLSVATNDSIVWIPSFVDTDSIVVNTTGFYTVVVVDAAGCTAVSQAVSVTVNPLPAAPVVSALGSTDVCAGSSLTLVSNVAGNLTWSDGSNNDTLVVGSNAACYSVVLTNANNCSATSNSICVTEITAPPSSVTPSGTVSICGGGSTVLSASSGASYLWSSGETTQTITAGAAGDYSVMVTYPNGCSSMSDTTTVNLFPLPATPVITANGPTTFCTGGSVVLSTGSASAYQWSSGETTATINVTASGSFSVTVTDANGCTASSLPQSVTVNSLPTASVTASGNTTFCSGGSVDLTSNAATGNLWSNGATTQTINVTAAGSYSVVVTANGCSATSNTILVNVNNNPNVAISLSGPPAVCGTSTVDLTATPSGLATYQWSNGSSTAGITVSTAGTYSVTATDQNGCSGTASQIITVGSATTPFITIGGSTIICEGESVQLLSSSSTGNLWSNGATTVSINVTATGNYSVTVTDANGCSATSTPVGVIVNPLPTASFTSNPTVGGFTTFTNTSTSFTSSQWDFGDGTAFSSQNDPTHTYQGDGSYTVVLTVFNDCGSATSSQTISIIGTGIEELGSGQVSIAPNPGNGLVTLSINAQVPKQVDMRILDATGRLILQENLGVITGDYRKNMDLTRFAKGMYILQLLSEQGSGTHRLIIE